MKWNKVKATNLQSEAEEIKAKYKKLGWSVKITKKEAGKMWATWTVWADTPQCIIDRIV